MWYGAEIGLYSALCLQEDANASADFALYCRLRVVLPRHAQPPKLADLKTELASITSIPYDQLKLVFGGLVMKNDKALLSQYGIKEGSKIMLIGTAGGVQGDTVGQKQSMASARGAHEQAARVRKQKEEDQSEEGLLRRIKETVGGVHNDLLPEIEQLERSVKALEGPQDASDDKGPAPPPKTDEAGDAASKQPLSQQLDAKGMVSSHRKLSEMLLRSLLSLDSVQVNSEATRSSRKAAVKDIQNLLDRVDSAWNRAKELGVKPNA